MLLARPATVILMSAFLVSTFIVALAEIGDKTQLLALVLSARFRKPVPIFCGILLATLLNHALAGALGVWVSTLLNPELLRWGLGLGFLVFAGWALIPDKLDETDNGALRRSAFLTTLIAFFLVEMGDKTQVATVALAMEYADLIAVVAGTTLGMLLANGPVIWLGNVMAERLPLGWIRLGAATAFAGMGLYVLLR